MASNRLLIAAPRIFPRGKCPGRPTIKRKMPTLPIRGALIGPHGPVARHVEWATTFASRRKGVRGRGPLSPDEALILSPCRQVHTIGVSFAIDAVFCDKALRILHVQTLRPRRISRLVGRARCCIELIAGRAGQCGLAPGVQLSMEAI